MRNFIRIPRILIPEEGHYEKWAVRASDLALEKAYRKNVEKFVKDAPSTLPFILPENSEDEKAFINSAREAAYAALEKGTVTKLLRGLVLVKRRLNGGVRRGMIAAIDLEAYTMSEKECSPVRPSEKISPDRIAPHLALRRGVPLEFPHTIVLYQDKKNKVRSRLEDEELNELYSFEPYDGGRTKGYFVPYEASEDVAKLLCTRGEPAFVVADGNAFVAAAKAYWEEVKATIPEHELEEHPARFTLVELVNVYDDAVKILPVHRVMTEIEPAVFCDYFMRKIKCKKVGNTLYPVFRSYANGVKAVDEILQEYKKQNGGKIEYVRGEYAPDGIAEDAVGIVLPAIDKEDVFSELKGGALFPERSFTVGDEKEARYCFEGREIGYD